MTPALVLTALAAVAQQPAQAPAAVRDTVVCLIQSDSLPYQGPCAPVRGTVQPPEIVKQGALQYPSRLLEQGIDGEVVVRMIVDTTGRPEPASIAIVRSPHPDFEAVVRDWVPTLEFRPARAGGRAVRVLIDVPLEFHSRAPAAAETSAQLLQAANGQIAAHNLDSAGALLHRVTDAPTRTVADRVTAWVLLGVVGFYATGDSAAAFAFRQALALDPGLQTTLDKVDPALAEILAAERAALPARAQPPPAQAAAVLECLAKCPEGVQPPRFVYFPRIEFMDASVRGRVNRGRTFLTFQVVINADGTIDLATLSMSGGTARNTEAQLRRGLVEARFAPARADGVPVRTRVTLRFDFEAEGTTAITYTYRVVAQ